MAAADRAITDATEEHVRTERGNRSEDATVRRPGGLMAR
jgi:hypothetical protein